MEIRGGLLGMVVRWEPMLLLSVSVSTVSGPLTSSDSHPNPKSTASLWSPSTLPAVGPGERPLQHV